MEKIGICHNCDEIIFFDEGVDIKLCPKCQRVLTILNNNPKEKTNDLDDNPIE